MRPRSPLPSIATVMLVVLCLSIHSGRAERPPTEWNSARTDDAAGGIPEEAAATDPSPLRTFPLPPDIEVRRQVVGLDGADVLAASGDEKLVYSNTRGAKVIGFTPEGIIADDLTLLAPSGCGLVSYSFQIIGTANIGAPGGVFRVDYALYDDCPTAGGKVIAGTGGFVEYSEATHGPGYDTVIYEVVVVPSTAATVTSTVWLGLKPNRYNVGVVIGMPAEVGFSDDRVDYPGFFCYADAGGFPRQPHVSFNANVYVDPACADAYPGYRNLQPGRPGFTEGSNKCIADDLELSFGQCDMVAYEVHVKGAGIYKFDLWKDADGLPGAVIPGTAQTQLGPSPPESTKNLRFPIDPVRLPARSDTSQSNAGAGGFDAPGRKHRTHGIDLRTAGAVRLHDGRGLGDAVWFPAYYHAGFDVTITALVHRRSLLRHVHTDEVGEAVCREVPEINCPTARLPGYPIPRCTGSRGVPG